MASHLLVLCLTLCASDLVSSFQLDPQHWTLYKSRNREFIEQFNERRAEEAGFTLGLSHLSDWTEHELAKTNGLIGPNERPANSPEAAAFLAELLGAAAEPAPESLDWRLTPGRVSPVKDQGRCGSDWAFASAGLLEGQQARTGLVSDVVDSLSAQELVDCSTRNSGCLGGNVSWALQDISSMGGIEDELTYARVGAAPSSGELCRFSRARALMRRVSGAALLPKADESVLRLVLARYGPVAVAIHASPLMTHYKSGVLDDDLCYAPAAAKVNRAALLVGYGTSARGADFWLVKGSLGADWGQAGYVYMSRNRLNQCQIASYATLATF